MSLAGGSQRERIFKCKASAIEITDSVGSGRENMNKLFLSLQCKMEKEIGHNIYGNQTTLCMSATIEPSSEGILMKRDWGYWNLV